MNCENLRNFQGITGKARELGEMPGNYGKCKGIAGKLHTSC